MRFDRTMDSQQGADDASLTVVVPEALAGRINPVVLAEREIRVRRRRQNEAEERVLRRRCAELLADHLMENLDD